MKYQYYCTVNNFQFYMMYSNTIIYWTQFFFLLTLGNKSREAFQFTYWKLFQLLLTNRLEQVKQVFYRSIKMIKPNINQFNCQNHNAASHKAWGIVLVMWGDGAAMWTWLRRYYKSTPPCTYRLYFRSKSFLWWSFIYIAHFLS